MVLLLLFACYLRADGRLSPPDGLAKYAERLPGSAFEHRPIWKAARENAQPHHCGKQKAPGIRWVDAGRYAAIALAGDNASAEECFQFAHALRHNRLTKPHCIADISHGCSGESACPKALHRGFERNAFIELTGSGQFLSIQLASY